MFPGVVPFSKQNEEIQTLPAQAAPEALADGVSLLWCLWRCQQHVNASALHYAPEQRPEFAVSIPDEEAWLHPERSHLPQLLGYPGISGMTGDREVHHPV